MSARLTLALLVTILCRSLPAQGVHLLPDAVVPMASNYPAALDVADLDGDGFLDIAARLDLDNGEIQGVGVLHGKGRGLFQEPDLRTDSTPTEIATVDVTGDGVPDIVAAGKSGSFPRWVMAIWVYPGQQGAPVADPLTSTLGASIGFLHAMAVGDVNEDGFLDVALSESAYPEDIVRLAFGNGDGTFVPSDVVTFDPEDQLEGTLVIADVDRDGHLDMMTVTWDYQPTFIGMVATLLGDGTGAFGQPIQSQLSGTFGFPDRLALQDMDHDGLPDVVASTTLPTGSHLDLLRNEGDGHFQALTPLPYDRPIRDLTFHDMDGDGVGELVVATSFGDPPHGDATVDVLDVVGRFQLGEPARAETGGFPTALVCGDVDDDGDEDVVLGQSGNPSGAGVQYEVGVGIAFNLGSGRFMSGDSVPADDAVQRVRAADLDGDGQLDLVAINAEGKILLSLQTDSAAFGPLSEVGLESGGTALLVAHLDPGPLPDLVYRKATFSEGLRVALGAGDGTSFVVGQDIGGGFIADVAAWDLDGDDVLDLIATDTNAGLYTWTGLGDGDFSAPTLHASSHNLQGVAVADVDGNGTPDLAVASNFPPAVVLYLGSPGGGLTPQELGAVVEPSLHIEAADFNGDGHVDLVTAGTGIQLLAGLGGGAFAPPVALTIPMGASDLIASDMNRDGGMDLVVTHAFGLSLSVLLGTGNGRFRPPLTSRTGGQTERVEVADFDDDGYPDVAVPTFTGIRILANRPSR